MMTSNFLNVPEYARLADHYPQTSSATSGGQRRTRRRASAVAGLKRLLGQGFRSLGIDISRIIFAL